MEAASPVKKKKLLFKPTALRKKTSQASEEGKTGDDLDFFKRSGQFVHQLTAEAERRARKKADRDARDRRSVTTEKREHPESDESEIEVTSSQKKRRVVKADSEDDMYHCTPPPRKIETPTSSRSRDANSVIHDSLLETPSKIKQSPAASSARSFRNRTVLDDEDEDLDPIPQPSASSMSKVDVPHQKHEVRPVKIEDIFMRTRPTSPTKEMVVLDLKAEDDDDDDDDDVVVQEEEEQDPMLREFIEKAKERQRAQKDETTSDRVMVIQISSRIPRTDQDGKPPVFRYSPDLPLKKVKEIWCQMVRHNGVDVDDNDIFLTWRGNRLYGTTTLESLEIKFMGSKKFYAGDVTDMADSSGFTPDRKRITMEAWTEELYEAYQQELEQERLRELGGLQGTEQQAPPFPQEEKIRITVRGKQGEPVKVLVPASGTIGDVIEKYRAKRNIPAEANILIQFDGENMSPNLSLEDADIADGEQVEVRLG